MLNVTHEKYDYFFRPAKLLRLVGQRGMIDLTFRVEHTSLKIGTEPNQLFKYFIFNSFELKSFILYDALRSKRK